MININLQSSEKKVPDYATHDDNNIKGFFGEYRWLSNFSPSPFKFKDISYPTVEHFYQAQKTKNPEKSLEIAQAKTAGETKKMGQYVVLRPDWEQVKVLVMVTGLKAKFKIPEYYNSLIGTKNKYLEETNAWHDKFWGVDCKYGKGYNILGQLLMSLRADLRARGI